MDCKAMQHEGDRSRQLKLLVEGAATKPQPTLQYNCAESSIAYNNSVE